MFKKKSKKSKESNTKSAYGNPQQSSYQPPPYLPGPQQQQQKPPSQYQQAGQAQAPPQQYQPQQPPQYKPQPQKQQKAPAGRPQTPPQQYQPQQQQQRSPSPNSRSSSQSSGGKKSKSKQKSQYSQGGFAPQQQPGQQQQYGQQQGQHNGRQQHGQQQYGQGAPPGGYQQQGAGFGGGGYAAGVAPMGAYGGGGGYGGGGMVGGGMAGGGMAGPVVPNGPPPAGLEVLNAVDCIVVNQHMEPLEILTGYETANRYSLHTAMGHPVYYAAEESSEMGRQFAGANRQFLMHIFDNMEREVMRLHRPSLLFTGGGFLSCEAPPGCQIGGVNRFDGMFNRGYQVMSVFGNPVFTVAREVNMVALTTPHQPFTIRNMAGVQVGAITKQYGGVLKEVHTDADTFFVNFPAQMEVQLKALLVAATFLIDYMEFENNQPDRDGTMNNYMGPRGGGMGYGMGYGMGMGYGYGGGFY